MIIEQVLVTKMMVFCYLLGDENSREGVLIDPAGDHNKIFDKIKKNNINIKWIINTHGHFDHTSGNARVIEKTNAKLLIHEAEKGKLEGRINRILSRLVAGKASPPPTAFLHDGDEIEIGNTKLRIIHTPGHTNGSICIYKYGHIFTGDTLFTEGMGRTDLPGANYDKIMDSIMNKILTLPEDTIIWPGHHYGESPTTTVREQRLVYSQ